MSLKELTKQKHQDAERTEFAGLLLSGNISKELYARYLAQMLEVYGKLEYHCAKAGLLSDLPGLGRAMNIFEDIKELDVPIENLKLLESTSQYSEYLFNLAEDESKHRLLMAHLYVRHMGDLYGGQMIAKKVPGSGKFYEFRNRAELIEKIRSKLDDSLGEEANVAFDHAIAIMKELNESSLEHTD
jgi:heme oxygenase